MASTTTARLVASAPPGRLVDVGTHRLHIRCDGHGSPAVVFDAALGASSLSWSLVAPAIAQLTRTCVYDRAGFGWSDAGPMPRTAGRIADELHVLLERAGVQPPYLLVGHSFGGMVMRLFAARHPDTVAALVLIEPAIPAEWEKPSAERRALIERGTRLCGFGASAARHGLAGVVNALVRLRALGAARAIVRLVSRGGLRREDEGILAPIWKLPPEVRAVLGRMWTQPKFFDALGSQIGEVCVSAAEVASEVPPHLGELPLVVITAAAGSPERLSADAALAQMSRRGRQMIAPDSGHWVPLDAPQFVIEAISGLIHQLRSSAPSEIG